LLWIANGATRQRIEDTFDLFGAHIDMATTFRGSEVTLALSWLNNLADSDSIQTAIKQPDRLAREVPGTALHASITSHPCTFTVEHVTALLDFSAADLGNGHERPTATSLELDYNTTLLGKSATMALARQQSSDAAMLELPRTRWLAAASIALDSHSTIGIEYRRDRQYSGQRTNQSLLKLSTIF